MAAWRRKAKLIRRETPDEALDRAFSSINMRLADDLLSEVLKLSPIAFERFVLDLMAKWGMELSTPQAR